MPDWIETFLPYVAPAAVAIVTTLFSASIFATRRLRHAISEDLAIVGSLNDGTAKHVLTEDVEQRVVRLSALNRFPVLVGGDGARMALLVAVDAFAIWVVADGLTNDAKPYIPDVLGAVAPLLVVQTWNWMALHASWSGRARARDKYLEDHSVVRDVRHAALVRAVGRSALMALGFISIGTAVASGVIPLAYVWWGEKGLAPAVALAFIAVFLGFTQLALKIEHGDWKVSNSLNEWMHPPLTDEARDKLVLEVRARHAWKVERKKRRIRVWQFGRRVREGRVFKRDYVADAETDAPSGSSS